MTYPTKGDVLVRQDQIRQLLLTGEGKRGLQLDLLIALVADLRDIEGGIEETLDKLLAILGERV